MPTAFRDLCIATIVAMGSDKFGIPVTHGEATTASGNELSNDPAAYKNANLWLHGMFAKHRWMFEAQLDIPDEKLDAVITLVKLIFEGHEEYVEDLRMQLWH